jgi:hypothetical protein
MSEQPISPVEDPLSLTGLKDIISAQTKSTDLSHIVGQPPKKVKNLDGPAKMKPPPKTSSALPKEPAAKKTTKKDDEAASRGPPPMFTIDKKENSKIATQRQKVRNYFKYFPHRLVPAGFDSIPNLNMMDYYQLQGLEHEIKMILDATFEGEYVAQAVVFGAHVIERNGPAIARRLSFLPGSDVFRYQHMLGPRVEELVKIPGDDGLADEINYIGCELTGWLPQSRFMSTLMKLARIFNENANANKYNLTQEAAKSGV